VVGPGARGKREVEVLILNILEWFIKKRIQNSGGGGVSSEKKSVCDRLVYTSQDEVWSHWLV
jgi:hypothetical protein